MNSLPTTFDPHSVSQIPSLPWNALRASFLIASAHRHLYVTPLHLVVAFWALSEQRARSTLLELGLDPDVFIIGLEEMLSDLPAAPRSATASRHRSNIACGLQAADYCSPLPPLCDSMHWYLAQLQDLCGANGAADNDSEYWPEQFTELWEHALADGLLEHLSADLRDLIQAAKLAHEQLLQ